MSDTVPAVIGPYASGPAACRDYDPRAAEVARLVAALVNEHLSGARLEHVGSTSVPGCAGQGIVDLLLPVADGQMATVQELLDRLGFQAQLGPAAFPETGPPRAGSIVHNGETFPVLVHVMPASSPQADEMRFLRACLRADRELVRAYVARKREIIAGGVTDAAQYNRLKGEFLKTVFG